MTPPGAISRRLMLRLGGLAVVGGAAASVLDAAWISGLTPTMPMRRLSLIPARDPRFDARVEELFPGLRRDPNFATVAPLAFLLTNIQGPAVRAHAVAWTMAAARTAAMPAAGDPAAVVFFYSRPNARNPGTGDRDLLAAGETRLVTPFFSWRPAAYRARPRRDWNRLLNRDDARRQLLGHAAAITVSLDAAIYADGVLAGEDRWGLATRYTAARNAERDEAAAILALLGPHPDTQAIAVRANALRARLSAAGEATWAADLAQLARRGKTRIRREV